MLSDTRSNFCENFRAVSLFFQEQWLAECRKVDNLYENGQQDFSPSRGLQQIFFSKSKFFSHMLKKFLFVHFPPILRFVPNVPVTGDRQKKIWGQYLANQPSYRGLKLATTKISDTSIYTIQRNLESRWLTQLPKPICDGIGSLVREEHLIFPYMFMFGTPYFILLFSYTYRKAIFGKKS